MVSQLLQKLVFLGTPANTIIILHPLAFAGWIGLLITGINLIPLGQLDGGHVFRSFLNPQEHKVATYISAFVLVFSGFFIMALLMLFFYNQYGHPGAQNDVSPLSLSRRILVGVILLLILLTFPLPEEIIAQIL